ncbi:MAG: dihydrofolate reductase family protein [Devosia sp.]
MDASEIRDDDIVYYLAASIDGFIAAADGSADWLNDYFVPELGFHSFMARIKGAIMGRTSWDKMVAMTGGKSAYGETPVIVATHRPLEAPASVTAMSGDVTAMASAARASVNGPVWLVGGASVATQLLAAKQLTRIDLFTIPVLLGTGIPAFRNETPVSLGVISTGTYPKGVTRTSYRPRP